MKIEARFRRRAETSESPLELNGILLNRLSRVPGLWKDSRVVFDAYFDAGQGESASTDLSPCLVEGIKGAISYASRLPGALADKAISDDILVIQLDTNTSSYRWLRREVFPELVRAFDPYRAVVVTDLEQDLDDFEGIVNESTRTGRDVDGRDTVFRIHPINYFDSAMCVRAFGLSVDEVIRRLAGFIPCAEHLQSGALLVICEEPIRGEQLIAVGTSIRQRLIA